MHRILAVLAAIGLAQQSFAQSEGNVSASASSGTVEKSVTVGAEPLWLLIGGLGAEVDARVSKGTSILLAGMYVPERDSSDSVYRYKWSTYDVYVGPKFMLTGDYDRSGWYVNPAVGYTGAAISDFGSQRYSGELESFQGRLTGGYHVVGRSGFRLTLGLGGRVVSSSDVVVRDGSGAEVHRAGSGALGGLAIDLRTSLMF